MTTTTDFLSSQSKNATHRRTAAEEQDITAAEEQLSLTELIRDAAASAADNATPPEIAQACIEKRGDDLRGTFLLQLVTVAVRDTLGGDRRTALSESSGSLNGRSHKLSRRREWWSRVLATRVPTADGSWKLLGQCTVDDLAHCIAERHELIVRTRMQIEHYEHLIQAMTTHGAAIVSDLTVEQVQL